MNNEKNIEEGYLDGLGIYRECECGEERLEGMAIRFNY